MGGLTARNATIWPRRLLLPPIKLVAKLRRRDEDSAVMLSIRLRFNLGQESVRLGEYIVKEALAGNRKMSGILNAED